MSKRKSYGKMPKVGDTIIIARGTKYESKVTIVPSQKRVRRKAEARAAVAKAKANG